MDDVSMSVESNDFFMDMTILSDYFTSKHTQFAALTKKYFLQ